MNLHPQNYAKQILIENISKYSMPFRFGLIHISANLNMFSAVNKIVLLLYFLEYFVTFKSIPHNTKISKNQFRK